MQFLKYTHFLPSKNCAQIPMYTAFEAIYPNVKSPPISKCLLTKGGKMLYLCNVSREMMSTHVRSGRKSVTE